MKTGRRHCTGVLVLGGSSGEGRTRRDLPNAHHFHHTPLAFPDHMEDYAALREHIKALTPRKAVKTLKAKLHMCLLQRKEAGRQEAAFLPR